MKNRHRLTNKTSLVLATVGTTMTMAVLFLLLPRIPSQAKAIDAFQGAGGHVSGYEEQVDTLWGRFLPQRCKQFCSNNSPLDRIPLSECMINVSVVRLHNDHMSNRDRNILAQSLYPLKRARICNFRSSDIDDRVLKYLPSFDRLEVMVLANCPVSDKPLAGLKSPPLAALDLRGTNVEGSFLESSRLKDLEYLSLSNTKLHDAGFNAILTSGTSSLRSLELDGTPVTDTTVRHIEDLSSIRRLSIADTKISDNALKHLARMHKITSLNLAGTAISDNGIKHLSDLDCLSHLVLRNTRITDSALAVLGKLKNLRWLDLRRTRVTQAGILEFRKTNPDICVFTN